MNFFLLVRMWTVWSTKPINTKNVEIPWDVIFTQFKKYILDKI